MERKTILITGINGFAASHLAKFLVNEGHDVHGTIRVRSDLHRIEEIKDKVKLHLIELSDPFSVSSVLNEVRPEEIYHLAAQSYVKSSWISPIETFTTTVLGTINLFEQIRHLDYKPNVLVTSTSEIYGEKVGDINEETIPSPNTPYGISKYTQDMLARMYHKAYGMNVVLSRSFNVTGYGRADVFVDSNFAKQVVEVEKGLKDVIKHGNLNSARDFTDIEDVVRGYVGIMRSGKWGEVFCLASGEPVKIQTVLDTLLKLAKVEVRTEIDPERMRPVDTASMKGDSSKAFKEFGWEKTISLETSLNNLLNYWRKKL
jgi:GDP-4-dehydro-6-deoxy-D-mannose reductase